MSQDIAVQETPSVPPEPEYVRVVIPSRLGPLGVEFRHTAISRLVVAPKGAERRKYHPLSAFEDSDFLDEVFGRLSEYLAGARRNLALETFVDPAEWDGFSRRVFRETGRVAYGKTKTYKEIAEAAGRPDAYRQVVAILERNPLPLLVPCHRVVPSKSGVGKWVGGVTKKKWLLKMEEEAAPTFVS